MYVPYHLRPSQRFLRRIFLPIDLATVEAAIGISQVEATWGYVGELIIAASSSELATAPYLVPYAGVSLIPSRVLQDVNLVFVCDMPCSR